jgi:hypothetical protein
MPFFCCNRPERDLDDAFRAIPPQYSEKSEPDPTNPTTTVKPVRPVASIHRAEWGTEGIMVLTAGAYPVYISRRKWKKSKHIGWSLSDGHAYSPHPLKPQTQSILIDKDPRGRPTIITVCGASYLIQGMNKPIVYSGPASTDESIQPTQSSPTAPTPTPTAPTPTAPIPTPTAPTPTAPTPRASALPIPEPPTPNIAPSLFPCSLKPCLDDHSTYPPPDPSKSGPWAKDMEIYALLQSPGGRAKYEKLIQSRGRRSVVLNND